MTALYAIVTCSVRNNRTAVLAILLSHLIIIVHVALKLREGRIELFAKKPHALRHDFFVLRAPPLLKFGDGFDIGVVDGPTQHGTLGLA